MTYLLLVVISVIVCLLFFIGRNKRLDEFHQDVTSKTKKRNSCKTEKYMSFSDVQETQNALKRKIETSLEDGEHKDLLLDIVSEWAQLRIKSFQDRRSWLRKPGSHDVQSPIVQPHGKIEH